MLVQAEEGLTWMDMIIQYLKDKTMLEDRNSARNLWYHAAYYTMVGNELYKKGYSLPYLRYSGPIETNYVLWEIHERMCKNHIASRSLAHKVVR